MGEAKAKAKAEAEMSDDEKTKMLSDLQPDRAAALRTVASKAGQILGDERLSKFIEERLGKVLAAPPPAAPTILDMLKAMMDLEARAIQIAQEITGTTDLDVVLPRAAMISKYLRAQLGMPPTPGVTM